MKKHIEGLLVYLKNDRQLLPRSLVANKRDLIYLFKATGVKEPKDITEETIKVFKEQMFKRNISGKTINRYLFSLRNILTYFQANKIESLAPNLVKTVLRANKRKIPTLLSKDELKAFLEAPGEPRENLLANMLFYTGMRLHELCKITIHDVKKNQVTLNGKGDKPRIIYFPESLKKIINEYIETRPTTHTDSLFSDLSPRQIQRLILRRGERFLPATAPRVYPHLLRHQFATTLLENGASLQDVRDLLGHSSISTTEIYMHLSNPHLKATHSKYLIV